MRRQRLESNLSEQCQRLREYLSEPGGPGVATTSTRAQSLSQQLTVSHSTTPRLFAKACEESNLFSAMLLAERAGRSVVSDAVDVRMGTANCVFLYAAPFRYPNTACGFLFSPSLEEERRDDGAASPFDSGGLAKHVGFPAGYGTPIEFLGRHEFPLPDHREYLQLTMENLFSKPEDYIEGTAPRHAGCLGLAGGDARMWTHEVRVPDRVPLRGRHLRAVFAHRALVVSNQHIQDLFLWCANESVDRIAFDGPGDGDFEMLQSECLSYLKRKLY